MPARIRRKPSPDTVALLRAQLDARLGIARRLKAVRAPKSGWINAIRCALGMSPRQLGERLNMSAQGVADLERREANGTITVGKLREAAAALNADVIVTVVPRTSLERVARAQATLKANAERNRIVHTMRLEAQHPGADRFLNTKKLEDAWLTERLARLWD